MFTKKTVMMALALGAVVSAKADDIADLKKALVEQQRELKALQNQVKDMSANTAHAAKNEESGSKSLIKLNKNIEGLKIKGDLRLRWQNENDKGNDFHGNQVRQRLRLGFEWATTDGWDIGVGLATGSGSATSTNDTLSDGKPFETGAINLDYAFAKHSWDNGWSLTLGQHKNPFVNSGILFDSDIRTVGVTSQYAEEDFFATVGGYEVYNPDKNTEDSSKMVAAQVGTEAGGFTAALGYFHFNSSTGEEFVGDKDAGFDIAHVYVGYKGKTDEFKYGVYGEFFTNLSADDDAGSQDGLDAEDETNAYVLGLDIGISDWKLGYQYAYVESDAMVDDLVDADFGDAAGNKTNIKAHSVKLGYKLTKNCALGGKYIMTEEIEGSGEGDLFQLDLKYKF